MTMSELRAQIVNLLQDAWELGYECGAKDISSARTVTLDAMTDADLAAHGLMRLPVDADGVTWTGTEQYAEFNGRKYIVDGIQLGERGWAVMAIDLNGALWRAPTELCRHVPDEPADTPARHRACAFAAWLALNTGLRCGECCGLARRDAQLFRSSLHVGATVVKVRGVAVRQERTKGGRDRNVSLAPEVADGVRRHLEWSETVAPALGPRSPLVTWDGRWELPDAVSAEFTSLCRELGVGPGVTFHSLRHTHATWLLLSGVDPKVVSERLGHADVSTTLRIYGHVLPGRDEAAARVFQAMVDEEIDGSGD